MQIGKLRNKIEIQARMDPSTTNGYGEPTEEWETVLTVWGGITTPTGKQLYVAEQLQAEVSHIVLLRYCDALTPRHRLKFGERIFNISFVHNFDERNIQQEVFCKEVV
jgi:SPP1 family predicted phage head-tail adaptor